MPGPAPSTNPRRRNATPNTTKLPAKGRAGDPPRYPLPRPSAAVIALWAELWATPQSVAWEQLGWVRIVARYAKALLEAEKSKAPIGLMAEVRQLEDRLGLTPMSMLRLRWEISTDELAERRESATRPSSKRAAKVKAFDPKLVVGQ